MQSGEKRRTGRARRQQILFPSVNSKQIKYKPEVQQVTQTIVNRANEQRHRIDAITAATLHGASIDANLFMNHLISKPTY